MASYRPPSAASRLPIRSSSSSIPIEIRIKTIGDAVARTCKGVEACVIRAGSEIRLSTPAPDKIECQLKTLQDGESADGARF
jgi:hypothetical protein